MHRVIIFCVLICTYGLSASQPQADADREDFFQTIQEKALYLSTGAVFGSLSLLAKMGSLFGGDIFSKECLYLSHLCDAVSRHSTVQLFYSPQSPVKLGRQIVPISQLSWHRNQQNLAEIPAISKEEQELLLFLEKHWLAKSTGFFSSMIHWVLPCFGIEVQVHPETTHSYARMTGSALSQTYKKRVESWKQSLPHPAHFPLILTRPSSVNKYLPASVALKKEETIETIMQRLKSKTANREKQILLDLTSFFPPEVEGHNEWQKIWNSFQTQFIHACRNHSVDPEKILCFQTLEQESVGGIRLLPLSNNAALIEEQHQFLQKWVSTFGLTVNRIELDRVPLARGLIPFEKPIQKDAPPPEKEEFLRQIVAFESSWKSDHPQKNLMVNATVTLLKALLASIPDEKWRTSCSSPTKSHATKLAFLQIGEQFKSLKEEASFFEIASHLEEIHASLASLLEIFQPYTRQDFAGIYRDLLTLPADLKPLISCAIHSSGMTSVAGIFKATENTLGRAPNILFGENAYFECINAAEQIARTCAIEEANEQDWKEVDLILGQFNPALKRIETNPIDYKVEKIEDALRHALDVGEKKSLVLALDCTLDYIDSPKVTQLLNEFQNEIKSGSLCVVAYRSGLKFDLFGMDNYSGAPLFMIHNEDPKWQAFDLLLTDPVLQADSLSTNWFSLAYQNVSRELEAYRKQIFENTRALLQQIPTRFFGNGSYRIVPVEERAEAAFIDIKISGPLHELRGSTLVGGAFVLKCLENGHPIFFRPSVGFYHPNFSMLFHEKRTTLRLTLGLDPAQVDLFVDCFKNLPER